jgi:hypothetical protein
VKHSIEYRRILHRMGYYDYQQGLIFRHLRQEGGWDEHCNRCRRFIIRGIGFYKPEKITVLGSGWLLDLPLAEMSELVSKISLIDIVHPPDVIRQVASFKNIELTELDITGGLIEEVWKKTRRYSFLNRLKSLDNLTINEYIPEGDPGLVISLNILTQLETLPVKFLKSRSSLSGDQLNHFRAEIQKKHIDFLSKYSSLLITDYEEVFINNAGVYRTTPTLVTELPSYKSKEEWTWDFDLQREDYYNTTCKMNVLGLII